MLLLVSLVFCAISVANANNVFQGDCSSEKVLCEQLCITISTEAYECSCWEGHHLLDDGLSCKANTNVQYSKERRELTPKIMMVKPKKKVHPSYRKVSETSGRAIAFKGNNYVEFPARDNTYLETNITMQFKLEEHKDGILFFAGQLSGDDFISLTLDGPNVVMRHDCGEGTIEDMYHGSFSLGEWHEINIWRKNCDITQMKVDDGRKLVDNADEFKNYKGITIDEGIFIGGAPNNIEFLREKTGQTDGFRGCVRLLVVNREILLDAANNVNKAVDLSSTFRCGDIEFEERDKNDTTVHIEMFDLTKLGLPMIVEEPKGHQRVDTNTNTPSPPLGHPVLKAIIESTTTQQSTTTKKPSTLKVAHFDGNGRILLAAPNTVSSYLELSIQFKAESENGLIFLWQENTKFLAVVVENSFVKVYASLGADTTVLRSENAVGMYHWQKLEVWRSGKGILLKINKQSWVESELHGEKSEMLDDNGTIMIGSIDKDNVPSVIQSVTGFIGCVKRIRLNGKTINLASNQVGITECYSDPCSSFGCPKQCITHNSQPICACQWPSIGDKCGRNAEEEISAMAFNGFSHLELDDESVMSHITGESLDLAVNLKLRNSTTNQHQRQIIISAGDINQEDDFMELTIDTNHFIRFAVNLGSGTVVLTHPKRIDIDKWTTIEVIRKKQEIKLSVNGEDPISGYAPYGAEQLNVYRNVFVGNNNDGTTDGKDYTGFNGCVISLRFDQTIISHPKQAKAAVNIEDCAI